LLNAHIWSNALRIWSNAQFVKCALDCHASGGGGRMSNAAGASVTTGQQCNGFGEVGSLSALVFAFLESNSSSFLYRLTREKFVFTEHVLNLFFYCGPLSRKAHCTHLFVKVHLLPLTVCPMLATNLRTTTRKVQNWQERCTQYRVVSVSRVIWRLVWS